MGRFIWLLGSVAISFLEAAEKDNSFETVSIWTVILIVALVATGILFFASRQIAKLRKFHENMLAKQLEMEEKQNQILTNMSENIHDAAQQALKKSQAIIENNISSSLEKEQLMGDIEDQLLGVTNDLIYFLRLKSKKIEINNKPFNFNNVLNEVSGLLGTKHAGKEIELIFDVNNNVPRHLIGDSLYIGRILTNLFEYMFSNLTDEELKLEVSMFNNYEDMIDLQFRLRDTGPGIPAGESESLFVPYYNEEEGTYVRLGLFIAKSLAELMGGSLHVESLAGKGTTFILDLPMKLVDPENRRRYRLPDKSLIEKKVLIVDSNFNSALAIKKMFAYFRHDVRVIKKEDFEYAMPKMNDYDIIILKESLFSGNVLRHLQEIKEDNNEVKIIALNNLLNIKESVYHDGLIDAHLFKPVNQERVFELIISLYDMGVSKVLLEDHIGEEEGEHLPKAKVYKSDIVEAKGITQESFAEFAGKQVLIVDDNLINQKVLTNLFSNSGIKISLACDGQQAVEIVKSGKVKFDFILMDINMPVMDGFSATQVIRAERKFDAVPIVAFTALILESEKQKMFSCGVNAFLAKPLNVGKLYQAMSMFISNKAIEEAKDEEKKEREAVFEGLNIEKGITHTNSNEALYIELIREFVEAYGESDKTFEKLVHEKRYEQIKMLCVDMRGLSGTIGAAGLHDLVNEVYKYILFNKQDLLPGYVEKYAKELSKVKRAIEAYLFTKDMME
ncbi:response regulator [Sulfurovum sp. zt1-1]|uniref:histidine kinase n=1 Tax=Sulfurovum zhangzhouensis TaxID=3019067 RepID=A0ABT7R0U7_9BACT|nr:response regulator [Sulfurovum zhangzhouensis]MDM5272703.1 response regulator [Sulfurovum zhangzhouensis]